MNSNNKRGLLNWYSSFCVVVVLLVVFSTSRSAICLGADFSLFDDFSEASIDIMKWQDGGEGLPHIDDGRLVIKKEKLSAEVYNILNFRSPETITSISTDVTIEECVNCDEFRAVISGVFYNGGSEGAAPGNHTGDILAVINVHANSTVDVWLLRCGDANCWGEYQEGLDGAILGNVSPGTTHRISLSWDGNATFLGQLDDGAPVEFNLTDIAPYHGPANKQLKFIGPKFNARNCALATVAFDNVHVNGSLYDNFDESPYLDTSMWVVNTHASKIEEGKLISTILPTIGSSAFQTNSTYFRAPESISGISSKVIVSEYTKHADNIQLARVGGHFFNDGSPGAEPNSTMGEIIASVNMTDTLVTATVSRIGQASFGQIESITGPMPLGDTSLGSEHEISVNWTGTVFEFVLDDSEPLVFDPTEAGINIAGPPNYNQKYLSTLLLAGEDGDQITASFDDVTISRNIDPTLIGAWTFSSNPVNSLTGVTSIVFLNDGYYLTWTKESLDSSGFMGYGTYTYDGQYLTLSSLFDQQLFFTGEDTQGMDFSKNTIIEVGVENDTWWPVIAADILFNKVDDKTNPIVGTWLVDKSATGSDVSLNNSQIISFYGDGYYLSWEQTKVASDPGFVEYGTYNYDGTVLIATKQFDQEEEITGASTRGPDFDGTPISAPIAAGILTLAQPIGDVRYVNITSNVKLKNTPIGTEVMIQPIDTNTGDQPITLTFATVTKSGTTMLETSETGFPTPLGYKLGSPPIYYELITTAEITGQIEVCIEYNRVSFEDESQLSLFHYEGDSWQNVTTQLDTNSKSICGAVSSFSPFTVFEKTSTEDLIVNIEFGPNQRHPVLLVSPFKASGHRLISVKIFSSDDVDVTKIHVDSIHILGLPPIKVRGNNKMNTRNRNWPERNSHLNENAPMQNRQSFMDSHQRKRMADSLTVYFEQNKLISALESALGRNLVDGELIKITLNGMLLDGTRITGTDHISVKRTPKNKRKRSHRQ